jgi:hypothetical protein
LESAYKPGSVVSSHSSRARVTTRLKQPTRVQRGPRQRTPIWSCSERGLPPLPVSKYDHRRYAFCCTFRRLAPPRSYLALCPMEPGLSSPVNPIPPKEISRKTAVAAQPTPRIDYHEIISCLKIIFIKISLKVAKKFSRLVYCLRERAKAYNSFFW